MSIPYKPARILGLLCWLLEVLCLTLDVAFWTWGLLVSWTSVELWRRIYKVSDHTATISSVDYPHIPSVLLKFVHFTSPGSLKSPKELGVMSMHAAEVQNLKIELSKMIDKHQELQRKWEETKLADKREYNRSADILINAAKKQHASLERKTDQFKLNLSKAKHQIEKLKDKLKTERRLYAEELEDIRTRLYRPAGERADGGSKIIQSKFNTTGKSDDISETENSDGTDFSMISDVEELGDISVLLDFSVINSLEEI